MKKVTILVLASSVLFAGCAGRLPNPVPSYLPGDENRSCKAYQAEIAQLNSDMQRILPENDKAEIQIEARFILVPVDTNEIKDFFEKEKLGLALIRGEPNLTNYVLNAEQVHRFLKLTQDIPGSKVLTAPEIRVLDGEELRTQRTIKYEYTNPNAISEQPEQKDLSIGTIVQVKPTLQTDNKEILLELDFEHSNLLGFEDGLPQMEITKIKTRVLIPNGQTLLIGGQKITSEEQDGQITEKVFLILVKAEEVEPENTQVE